MKLFLCFSTYLLELRKAEGKMGLQKMGEDVME
jgi:hypothetical protein